MFSKLVFLLTLTYITNIFAQSIEQPSFSVLANKDGYVIREYAAKGPQWWAETVVDSDSYTYAQDEGFQRLFDFIEGANSRNQVINMTAPVTISVGQDNDSYAVRFFMPSELNGNIPTPTNPEVAIVQLKQEVVAVIEFGGWATWYNSQYYISELLGLLQKDKIATSNEFPIRICQYDSPFVLFNRTNEIWVGVQWNF